MATYAQLFYPALSGLEFDGAALNAGLLYFYEPGTTTFRTVYTNRTKTVQAANPYTLDSNGQAEVFLDGVYDVVVKTSGGVTKATWENYEAGFTLDGFTASSTPTANQIVALNSSSEMILPNAVHKIDGNKIWHAGNDGAASGLDADKLDGQEGAYYAPLLSPTFTGTPAAPTAAVGTNTTQLATTAFVKAQIATNHFIGSWVNTLPGVATLTSIAHGLSTTPDEFFVQIECITGEHGYSSGDRINIPFTGVGTFVTPLMVSADSTSVRFTVGNAVGVEVLHKTAGTAQGLTAANWKYRAIARIWPT